MLVGKKKPAIFVYDLQTDELRRVALDLENVYPGFPCFDETGSGIVFHGFSLPSKKLGLIYCLNRPTALYHIKDVRFVPKKKKGSVEHEKSVSVCLTKSLAVAFQPFFSKDFSKLVFVGREEMFLHHSGNYELYCVDGKIPLKLRKKLSLVSQITLALLIHLLVCMVIGLPLPKQVFLIRKAISSPFSQSLKDKTVFMWWKLRAKKFTGSVFMTEKMGTMSF